ncbi:MAG: phosphatidate cytidylyltransferase [Proteobacteria bacterium]|nr:phosphatidate cytidylyltransferase [Pseudomonadota bacterium]
MSTQIPAQNDPAPGFRGVRFNMDWITRPLFGLGLAAIAIAAIFGGGIWLVAFLLAGGIAALREWHRMVGEPVFGPMFFVSAIALAIAALAQLYLPMGGVAWPLLCLGAVAIATFAALSGKRPLWQGFGPLYVGAAILCVIIMRAEEHGAWIILGMLLAIWATDTGALIVGNLVGGARLWPALSPNKTWSGTLGGVACAAIVEAVFISAIGGEAGWAALLGALIATVGHCGDLFESWVKRHFHLKDSGGLIPGHGGMLDRIDSTLFVAPALALVMALTGFNPLLGAHP